jgi:hypothetical protein
MAETQGRRLVLGFDGGCFTCADLAQRIEERLEGKIEVKSLHDPQVVEWRKQALGKLTLLTPMLFEIDGDRIASWSGWQIGFVLSRRFGVATSWKVMQILGEATNYPYSGAVTPTGIGISRKQFLKGVGGTVVAMSIFAGSPLFSAIASANGNTGTQAQRDRTKSIVRSSKSYKTLAVWQDKIGARFNWGKADYRVDAPLASVGVPSADETRSILVLFFVNLRKERVLTYHPTIFTPARSQAVNMTRYIDGNVPKVPYHKQTVGGDWVATQDNRLVSHKQFRTELNRLNQNSTKRAASSSDANKRCKDQNATFCGLGLGAAGGGALAFALYLIPGVGPITGTVATVGYGVSTYLACKRLVNTCDQMYPEEPPPVTPQPPSYYCPR